MCTGDMGSRESSAKTRGRYKALERVGVMMRNMKHIEILAALHVKAMTVEEVAATLKYDDYDISRNLEQLRRFGLVREDRLKRKHVHRLSESVSVRRQGPGLTVTCRVGERDAVTINHTLDGHTAGLLDAISNR